MYASISALIYTQYITGQAVRSIADVLSIYSAGSFSSNPNDSEVPSLDLTNPTTLSVLLLQSQRTAWMSTARSATSSVGGIALTVSTINSIAASSAASSDLPLLLRSTIMAQAHYSNLYNQYTNGLVSEEAFVVQTTPAVGAQRLGAGRGGLTAVLAE